MTASFGGRTWRGSTQPYFLPAAYGAREVEHRYPRGPIERVGITSEATIHIKLSACDTMQALSSSVLDPRSETKTHAEDPNSGCGRQAALGSPWLNAFMFARAS